MSTLRLNTISDGLQALLQGRGDALAGDAATLIVIAARDQNLRMVGEIYALSDAAVGLRKNEPEWMAWVNAAVARMKAEDLYRGWISAVVAEDIRQYYIDAHYAPRPPSR